MQAGAQTVASALRRMFSQATSTSSKRQRISSPLLLVQDTAPSAVSATSARNSSCSIVASAAGGSVHSVTREGSRSAVLSVPSAERSR
ncbi:MAG: hypothetical protein H6Q01_1136 [Acidobacteria bacterium]|nr:hypothetical protein [Acidobacteriota bacterium]